MVEQFIVGQPWLGVVLNPVHSARGHVRCWSQTRHILEHLEASGLTLKVMPTPLSFQPPMANTLPPTFQTCEPPHCTT